MRMVFDDCVICSESGRETGYNFIVTENDKP